MARLALVQGVVTVLASGLGCSGSRRRGNALILLESEPVILRCASGDGRAATPSRKPGTRMADDRNPATMSARTSRGRAPRAGASDAANDPLAELARLIGQNDPFAEFPPPATRPSPTAPPANSRRRPGPRADATALGGAAEPRRRGGTLLQAPADPRRAPEFGAQAFRAPLANGPRSFTSRTTQDRDYAPMARQAPRRSATAARIR